MEIPVGYHRPIIYRCRAIYTVTTRLYRMDPHRCNQDGQQAHRCVPFHPAQQCCLQLHQTQLFLVTGEALSPCCSTNDLFSLVCLCCLLLSWWKESQVDRGYNFHPGNREEKKMKNKIQCAARFLRPAMQIK